MSWEGIKSISDRCDRHETSVSWQGGRYHQGDNRCIHFIRARDYKRRFLSDAYVMYTGNSEGYSPAQMSFK